MEQTPHESIIDSRCGGVTLQDGEGTVLVLMLEVTYLTLRSAQRIQECVGRLGRPEANLVDAISPLYVMRMHVRCNRYRYTDVVRVKSKFPNSAAVGCSNHSLPDCFCFTMSRNAKHAGEHGLEIDPDQKITPLFCPS